MCLHGRFYAALARRFLQQLRGDLTPAHAVRARTVPGSLIGCVRAALSPSTPRAVIASLPLALVTELRISIRVRPGSSRAVVGGDHGGALVVRVCEQAVDGRATEAALRAVAAAFGVARRELRLVSGPTSREKVVAVTGDPAVLASILARLRDAS